MSFSAINTVEQEIKQRNERHTLELQLEQAMSVYQEALEAQYANNFELSDETYRRLFSFDALKPIKQDNKHSNIVDGPKNTKISAKSLQLGPATRLRAMALKNYALLLLSQPDISLETVEVSQEYLAEALDLVGSEDREKLILPSLAQVAWSLGKHRQARLSLELLSENSEGSAIEPLKAWETDKKIARKLLGPKTLESLEALHFIKLQNHDVKGDGQQIPEMLDKFPNLRNLSQNQPSLEETLEQEGAVEISLGERTWSNLIASLNDTLNSASRKLKRKGHKDSYSWSQRILWNTKFVGPEPSEVPKKKDEDVVQDTSDLQETTEPIEVEENSHLTELELDTTTEQPEVHTPVETEEPTVNDDTEISATPKTNNTDPSSPESHKRDIHPASPAKRRRIERVKRNDLALPADFGVQDENFTLQSNGYLALVSKTLKLYSPAFLFLSQTNETRPELVNAAELRDVLARWDKKESNLFLSGATSMRKNSGGFALMKKQRNITVNSNDMEDEDDEEALERASQLEATEVDAFLSKHGNMHIQQIRWSLAVVLLSKLSAGGKSIEYGDMVFRFVSEIDSLLWSRKDFLNEENLTTLFALYANAWIQKRDSDNELKMHRWQCMSAIKGGLNHLWISAAADQESSDAAPDSTVAHFEAILPLIIKSGGNPERFSYLQEIPTLSVESTYVQISKFKAAAAFERVLSPVNHASLEDQQDKNDEDISLLQAMLMPEKYSKPEYTSDSEYEAIQNFLAYAPSQFKMGLWYTLLEKYEASGSASNSLLGLVKIFTEAMNSLGGSSDTLLQTLSVSHDVAKRMVPLLNRCPEVLDSADDDMATSLLENTVKLLQILQLFIVYDDAVNSNLMQKPITPSWSKVLPKFRELVVMWWCIYYRTWARCASKTENRSPETYNDILSIIHERLGTLGYCSAADRCLLTLHCNEIARLDWDGSAMDLSQCLKCKFGLTLSLYGDVANHHTVPEALKPFDANQLLPLITRLIFKHRSFNQLVMRMDTRAVIDEFAKLFQVQDETKLRIRQENVITYLTKDFTSDILRKSRMGYTDSQISYPKGDAAHGVWILQGIVLMNQYRMRRRQAYSALSIRIDTLGTAIDLFQRDLAAHPNRFESWVSLTQIYQYMCEDCLTFGDELPIDNTPEIYCRKALLAACAAIAIKVSQKAKDRSSGITNVDTEDFENALQPEFSESLNTTIIPLFGYLLYLAVIPPINQKVFSISERPFRPFLVSYNEVKYFQIALMKNKEVSENQALKISLMCLDNSAGLQQEWNRALLQVLIAMRLELESERILDYAKKAREICPSGNLDAVYMTIHAVWFLMEQHKIKPDEAVKELNTLQLLKSEQAVEFASEDGKARHLIIENTRTIIEKDKWMHRARFLMAKIYEIDYSDPKNAQKELMELFSLKSPTKPLVIWRRESDIPGQHSVYMTEYVRYMTDLMYINTDTAGLLLMAKRFRKAGLEMCDHSATFDHIYTCATNLIRSLIPSASDPKHSDSLMLKLSADGYEKFELVSKAMADPEAKVIDESKGTEDWINALIYTVELRKNHSGPATMSNADDILIIIYLNIYFQFVKSHPEAGIPKPSATPVPTVVIETPEKKTDGKSDKPTKTIRKKNAETSQNKKRVIRKDVITAAQQFLKPYQSRIPSVEELGLPEQLYKCL